MKHLLIILPLLLIMSGCTPHVMSSNPRQVTIGNAFSSVKSQKLADKTCQKHGRWAILRLDNIEDGNATYECVE